MRDRLIELLGKSDILCDDCGEYGNTYCIEAIADYLIANGVIVPPCKVGDTVYVLGQTGHTPTVLEGNVAQFVFNKSNPHIDIGFDNSFVWDFHAVDFGKTVFLTKEQAEQALKEREQ